MIYITGDTHGSHPRFADFELMRIQKKIKAGDYLIICGDFGYLFDNSTTDNRFLDILEKEEPYDILFVDGNHENFKAIYSYPVEEWNGGKVHRIRKNIFHLMRGQIFVIDGCKIFTMGGAYSIDRYMRRKDVSYWDEELPNNDEYKEAIENLRANNNEVDIVITHTAPKEIIRMMGYYPDRHDEELTGFFDWVMHECGFRKWFFGHWHEDREIADKFRAVYMDTLKLNE